MNSIYNLQAQTLGNDINVFFPSLKKAVRYIESLYKDIERVNVSHRNLTAKIYKLNENYDGYFSQYNGTCIYETELKQKQ